MRIVKKAIIFVLTIAVICTMTGLSDISSALAATSGDYVYTDNGDGTCTITDYRGAGGSVTIPDTLDGLTVTTIGYEAFYRVSTITTVIMSNSITSIEDKAFSQSSLTEVALSENITSIGVLAFSSCLSLSHITIPEGVVSLSTSAFGGCRALESAVLPDSLTDIGVSLFSGCINLSSVILPSGITTIPAAMFAGCAFTDFTIPESVIVIESSAFQGCNYLQNITIPKNVADINPRAFFQCNILTEISVDANNNYYAADNGILYDKAMTKLLSYPYGKQSESYIVPSFITEIGEAAFVDNNYIKLISLPENLEVIGDSAFGACDLLSSINIPDNVTSIGEFAFYSCPITEITLPEGMASISPYLFYGCESLTEVTIPETVETIGLQAFYGCISLDNIELPDGLTYIGEAAFSGCTSLTNINIPEGIAVIERYSFNRCSNLSTVVLHIGTTEIGEYAFQSCRSLESIKIPDGVSIIDDAAFRYCSKLKSVIIPSSVIFISRKYVPLNDSFDSFAYCDDNLVFYGIPGSYAETYANSEGIEFLPYEFCAASLNPSNNEINVYNKTSITIRFNERAIFGEGTIYLRKMSNDEVIAEVTESDLIKLEFDMGFTIPSDLYTGNLQNGEEYYVTIPSDMVKSTEGKFFAGFEKGDWIFKVEELSITQFPKYVDLDYPGILFENTTMPPQPSGNNTDYAAELQYWAEELGYDDILSPYDYEDLLNLNVKYPVMDMNQQLLWMSDESITVKQVMSDIIFLSEYQKKCKEETDKVLYSEILHGRDLSTSYTKLMDYYGEYQDYLSKRDGSDAGVITTAIAAVLSEYLIEYYLNDVNTYKLVKDFPEIYIEDDEYKNNAIYQLLSSDSSGYDEGIQDAVDLFDIIGGSKKIYNAHVKGSGTDNVVAVTSLACDFAEVMLERNNSQTARNLSSLVKIGQSGVKAYKLATSVGAGTLELPVFIMAKYMSIAKSFIDWEEENVGGWYFYCNYYLAQEYPDRYKQIFDEIDLKPNLGQFPTPIDTSDPLGHLLLDVYNDGETGGIATGQYASLIPDISSRFEIAYAASFTRTVNEIYITEMQHALLKYICASKNTEETNSISISVECPVSVKVLDQANNIVAYIDENGASENINEYGTFYVFGENNEIKYFYLTDDMYKVEMEAYDTGNLDCTIVYYAGGNVEKSVFYKDVLLSNGMDLVTYTNDVEADLLLLSNGDTNAQLEPTVIVNQSLTPEEISLNCNNLVLIEGQNYMAEYQLSPTDCYQSEVTWISRDEEVASVENGLIVGLKAGETEIMAVVNGTAILSTCKITVLNATPVLSNLELYEPKIIIDTPFDPEKKEYSICGAGEIMIYASTNYPDAIVKIDGVQVLESESVLCNYIRKSTIDIEVVNGEISNIYKLQMVSADSNDDAIIDMLDLVCIAKQYNMNINDVGFINWYDLNFDNKVNLFDLVINSRFIS